jgi:hypothetical protein
MVRRRANPATSRNCCSIPPRKTEFNDPDWTVGIKLGRDRSNPPMASWGAYELARHLAEKTLAKQNCACCPT